MADKNKMVDFPDYNPDARVPFPPQPGDETPFGKSKPRKEQEQGEKQPYYETYAPDPPTPDPSQTTPGAPDIRDPATKNLSEEQLKDLSPNIDLKERAEE